MTAAKIISWINIGFWAALLVIGLFFVVLAAVASAQPRLDLAQIIEFGGIEDVRHIADHRDARAR